MPAIMKNDEETDKEPCRRDGKEQDKPIRNRKAEIHQAPKDYIRYKRVEQLPCASAYRWAVIISDDLHPRAVSVIGLGDLR